MNAQAAEAEAVVQAQLDAYNARDIAAFIAVWSDDAQYYAFPDTLLASGAAAIRERHVARFREPNLHGRLIGRVSLGGLVIDREIVTRSFPDGPGRVHVVAIYEVSGGKITKAWFRQGEPMLDAR
jgi:putative hydrolase of HD superfamily